MTNQAPAQRPSLKLENAFDVLVVGGGAAGLYSALCLPQHLKVGLITKDTLSLSASDWAQGGIAAAIAPDDQPQLHVADTLSAGAGLCELDAVSLLVHQARDCINSLVEMGVAFDRSDGQLAMTLEAAHSRRRVLHAADTTGRAVVTTLANQVLQQDNIQVFNQAFALDLWLSDQGHCQGISLVYNNQICWIQANAVVLATGGGGQVYTQTTNPIASTGDGVAMAWRAGAHLRDLEFMQFHPTALTQPGAPHFLISEAVRGEGAHLIDATGHRFAFDYHPDGELAPRDVVSRAIFNHLQKTDPDSEHPCVWLDLRPIPPERIQYRFPNIIRKCKKWAGLDIFQDPIPVSPAAHYWMGGITTNLASQTSIPGLYAVGENASTGVHGANRLASNSLLECLVYGAQLKNLELSSRPSLSLTTVAPKTLPLAPLTPTECEQFQTLRLELAQVIWQTAGIARNATGLTAALETLAHYQQVFDGLAVTQVMRTLHPGQIYSVPETLAPPRFRQWGELRNLLEVAALILKSALFRTESRGGHYRSDYQKTDPNWKVHTHIQGERCWPSQFIQNDLDLNE